MHTKQKRTHLYWKWKPLSCLFTFGNKTKTSTYQLCKRQLADTNVLIGQFRLLAKRPIIGASLTKTQLAVSPVIE